MVFFGVFYISTYFAMENILRPSWYTKLDRKERIELVQNLNATAHHLTQVIVAIINILYLCDKVGG